MYALLVARRVPPHQLSTLIWPPACSFSKSYTRCASGTKRYFCPITTEECSELSGSSAAAHGLRYAQQQHGGDNGKDETQEVQFHDVARSDQVCD